MLVFFPLHYINVSVNKSLHTFFSSCKSRLRSIFETVALRCHCPEKPLGTMPSVVLSHLPQGTAECSIWKAGVSLLVEGQAADSLEILQKLHFTFRERCLLFFQCPSCCLFISVREPFSSVRLYFDNSMHSNPLNYSI